MSIITSQLIVLMQGSYSFWIPGLFMTFHDQKKSNSMTFRTILGNEHIRSKYGNFKEQHNASFKPQSVNKRLLYGNLHITIHNINNKITELKL